MRDGNIVPDIHAERGARNHNIVILSPGHVVLLTGREGEGCGYSLYIDLKARKVMVVSSRIAMVKSGENRENAHGGGVKYHRGERGRQLARTWVTMTREGKFLDSPKGCGRCGKCGYNLDACGLVRRKWGDDGAVHFFVAFLLLRH